MPAIEGQSKHILIVPWLKPGQDCVYLPPIKSLFCGGSGGGGAGGCLKAPLSYLFAGEIHNTIIIINWGY